MADVQRLSFELPVAQPSAIVLDGETLTIKSFDGKTLELSYVEPFTSMTFVATYQKQ